MPESKDIADIRQAVRDEIRTSRVPTDDLRDRVAIAALTGYLASFSEAAYAKPLAEDAAAEAYRYADAFMVEREKGRGL